MINFPDQNKKNGFTFIELVLAVTIIGIAMISLFNLQSSLFNSAIKQHSRIIRIFNIKNLFFDYEVNEKIIKDKSLKKDIQDPATKISYEMIKPKDKSTLKKFEDIYLLKAIGSWERMKKEQEEIIVSLLFNPKPPSKEKKSA